MNIEFFEKWFNGLSKESDEFQKVFEIVNESYFTFENPDDMQEAARFLNLIVTRAEPNDMLLCYYICTNVIKMKLSGLKAATFQLGLTDPEVEYNVDIYSDKTAFSALKDMVRNAVVMKDKEAKDEQS